MSISKILVAAEFAAQRHRDQRRKDTCSSPYINHPISVARVLSETGSVSDIELLTAALLHDTVEDTKTSMDDIEQHFGAGVRELVAEVTDDKSLPKADRKQHQIDHAPHISDRGKQLKLADKISNIRDIDHDSPDGWPLERKLEYLQWGEAVVAGCRGVNPALDQLFDQTVAAVRTRLDS